MDAAGQAVRWTIPGWLFILFLFMFEGPRILFGQPSGLWEAVAGDGRLLLGIAAAGLPIGFLIYQIYFWMYWVVPVPGVLGVGQPLNRAEEILKDVLPDLDLRNLAEREWEETEDTPLRPAKFGPITVGFVRVKDRSIMMDYRNNWLLVNFLWHRMIVERQAHSLERVASGLHDIYHSLGTARWAVLLGFGLHTVVTVVSNRSLCTQAWLALLVNGFLTVLFFRAFHAARYDTLAAIIQFKHDFLTYYHRHPPHQNTNLVPGE